MLRHLALAAVILLLGPVRAEAQGIDFAGGTWEWISTSYTAGGTDTPASVGYSTQLHFGTDHSFVRYRDEVPLVESTWSIGDIVAPPYMIEVLTTGAGDWWLSPWVSFGNPMTLVLADSVTLPTGTMGPNTRRETYVWRLPVSSEQSTWGQVKAAYR
ncbi:MAG: hypothetical protein IPH48_06750 [bacterium]|jgi:hypothetical protein|nr:hypothetical protein [bacterium]